MAQIQGVFSTEAYRNAPWSKRASMLPRKTYSAESKIIYKRRKHEMSMQDAERIMNKVMARQDDTGEPINQGFFNLLMAFLQKLTVKLLKYIMPGLVSWAVQPIYTFIHDLGATIIDSLTPSMEPEKGTRLRTIFMNFLSELYDALRNSWIQP